MRLGIDLDGVVCDYQNPLIKEFNKLNKKHYSIQDIKTYNLINLGGSKQEIKKIVENHSKKGIYKNLKPIYGAIKGLKEISKKNSIHILTYRNGQARPDTVRWLEKRKIPYDTLTFTNKKGKYSHLLNLDWVVDDCIDNLEDLFNYSIRNITFDQPWNQDYTNPLNKRVKNWNELIKLLK